MEDLFMKNVQALEQLQAFMRDFAGFIKAYHNNLERVGFTKVQAFTLTADYHRLFLSKVLATPVDEL